MRKLRVLIVDDSVVFRSQIKAVLEKEANVEVMGLASNGRIALERLSQMPVDLMTLDLEMPEMNGLQTLQEMKRRGLSTKVIVFSSQTTKGADAAMEALSHGASDVVAKPSGTNESLAAALLQIKAELLPKILQFLDSAGTGIIPKQGDSNAAKPKVNRMNLDLLRPEVVVIGSSTGGPDALEKIFSGFAQPLACPILIAQHMPPVFTASLARRLEKLSGIPTAEAVQWEMLRQNRMYVAPGDFHMSLVRQPDGIRIRLDQGPKRNSVRPAVDPLFETAAELFGNRCVGYVLTGMGEDGLIGAQAIKNSGGGIMIQDKTSCVVFGMPGAIYNAGIYDKLGDLAVIKNTLERQTRAATILEAASAA